MAFIFGKKQDTASDNDKTLVVNKNRCPQNHPCPAVQACPVGALVQVRYNAPTVDVEKCIRCGKCERVCPMRALKLE